jgi:hydroxymethylpyrimidine pyrophosphatase-like HAD family hydrolase
MPDQSAPGRRFDAVICDIDGCLAPEASAPIHATGLAEIAEYNRLAQERRDRPVVTLCSGRPEPFVEAVCRTIGNRTLPAIAENGVWLFHPESNGWDRDPAITSEHLAMVGEAQRWVETELGPRGVTMQPGKAASISLYHADTAFLRTLEGRVRSEFERRGWPLRVSMTWLYINCDLAHVNKGTAIDRMMRLTGLRRERTMGIGDTAGDVYIADRVAWFGCPANAAAPIRQRAEYVAKAPEVEGVLEMLELLR